MAETLGERVRAAREGKGITQADLAIAARVRQLAISEIERGITTDPKSHTLAAIADALDMSVDELLGRPVKTEPYVEPDLPPRLAAFLDGTRVTESERRALVDLPKRRSDGEIDYAEELHAIRTPAHKRVEDRAEVVETALPANIARMPKRAKR